MWERVADPNPTTHDVRSTDVNVRHFVWSEDSWRGKYTATRAANLLVVLRKYVSRRAVVIQAKEAHDFHVAWLLGESARSSFGLRASS